MDYEVEARAREAIEQLKYRYWRACDAKDPRGFRECFVASGGVVDFGPLGRTDPDTMVGIFEQIALATAADGGPRILDMHHGFMPTITIGGRPRRRPGSPAPPPAHPGHRHLTRFRQIDRDKRTEALSTGEYWIHVENGRWVMASACSRLAGRSRELTGATVTYPEVTTTPGAPPKGRVDRPVPRTLQPRIAQHSGSPSSPVAAAASARHRHRPRRGRLTVYVTGRSTERLGHHQRRRRPRCIRRDTAVECDHGR